MAERSRRRGALRTVLAGLAACGLATGLAVAIGQSGAAAAPAPETCGVLAPGESLHGSELSCDGTTMFENWSGGDLDIKNLGHLGERHHLERCDVGPAELPGGTRTTAVMQYDGNFVLYLEGTWTAVWHTATNGNPGAWLNVQDNGDVVIYAADGRPLVAFPC